ncbi:MAG: zonular occludens toxin domain-containing protein, partial [Panacagrimonas sp.]
MIYIFTGHLGSGKTLAAITLAIEEYAYQGRR